MIRKVTGIFAFALAVPSAVGVASAAPAGASPFGVSGEMFGPSGSIRPVGNNGSVLANTDGSAVVPFGNLAFFKTEPVNEQSCAAWRPYGALLNPMLDSQIASLKDELRFLDSLLQETLQFEAEQEEWAEFAADILPPYGLKSTQISLRQRVLLDELKLREEQQANLNTFLSGCSKLVKDSEPKEEESGIPPDYVATPTPTPGIE